MIVTLTPNPAVDVTYRIGAHALGDTNRVREVQRRPGGKGVNVARVLAAVDVPVRALLPLGGEAGRWLGAALDVPFAAVPISGENRTTVTVTGDGHPTVYTEPGPEVSEAEWRALGARLAECLSGADLAVVSGSLPRGASPDLVAEWVRIAREAGVRTLVDASGPSLLTAARAGALVKPNQAELLAATSAPDEAAGAAALLRLGAPLVVVSRGAAGIAAYTSAGVFSVPAIPGVHGNPTGAGDAATAGLALALAAGRPLIEALRTAAALGAAAVLRPVAGEVDLPAYHRFLNGAPA
ncbi:1-phosphofructokinase [Amycolatopsis sp. AA4]|uniref:1-phosphofructokinase family hexose kinase n=1 Tax=Actinomycetes TaxID=1760 RepID=UPI0001B57AAE|nr:MULTISPECIES: hexose kinase [Actinomycetes]ATY11864.1 1-phosphofructokinase [Amycolatopsis sp. AA4]EFL07548.1 1-phosphofructokinase [Streptomyces sp. AA4]